MVLVARAISVLFVVVILDQLQPMRVKKVIGCIVVYGAFTRENCVVGIIRAAERFRPTDRSIRCIGKKQQSRTINKNH